MGQAQVRWVAIKNQQWQPMIDNYFAASGPVAFAPFSIGSYSVESQGEHGDYDLSFPS